MMRINPKTCSGCRACVPYCPVGAIGAGDGGVSVIDRDGCVECGVCARSAPCPTASLVVEELPWPRSLRALFSDPLGEHVATGVPGRGTEEMKTNEVTGRFRPGQAGLTLELGRPGVGTRLGEVEVVTRALAALGVVLSPDNPVTALVADPAQGSLDRRVQDERVLSVVLECVVDEQRLGEVLTRLRTAAASLATVMSVGVIGVVTDGDVPLRDILRTHGFEPAPNGKVNVALGRQATPAVG